ncbi:hypothetical protein KM043_016635 [Ampulex compressa]|nr:hypothetical protein KM043_016635 [Ampulex compressa]
MLTNYNHIYGVSSDPNNTDNEVLSSSLKNTQSFLPPTKRKKAASSRNIYDQQENTQDFARFLVMKRINGDFSKVSPFLINKVIINLVGSVKDIRKIKEGLLIEVFTAIQANKLLECQKFGDYNVYVSPHTSLNYCKGVISCKDLMNCSIEGIQEELKNQGVIAARRITTKRNQQIMDTPALILIFNSHTLPSRVKCAMYSLPVRLYIPNPMQCFRCHKFGLAAQRCPNEQTCICGKAPHVGDPCLQPVTCINCSGPHTARSKNCAIYKQEFAIQKVKVEKKISYQEAKKQVQDNPFKLPTTFARITAQSPVNNPAIDSKAITDTLIPIINSIISSQMKELFHKLLPTVLPSLHNANANSSPETGKTTQPPSETRLDPKQPSTSSKTAIITKNNKYTSASKSKSIYTKQKSDRPVSLSSVILTGDTQTNKQISETKPEATQQNAHESKIS